jgi:ferrochelatase
LADSIRETWAKTKSGVRYRLLLSAHGLPERVVAGGDPYQWQVERTAAALVEKLGIESLDHTICYQSRVGPLKWIGPSTDGEIRRAGSEGLGVVVAPVAFVSEHTETLVELDIEYSRLAHEAGVADYLRAPTVGVRAPFIAALADLVTRAASDRLCPARFGRCGFREVRP